MAVRLQLYGLASTAAFVVTVLNAFRQRPNFYSAAVYLSKSSACKMVLWNQAVFQTILLGKVFQQVFFGNLRMIEVEERSWFAITETLLALTIFKDEFDSSFIILFIVLLFVKVFHWLASDRVEWMEQTASVPRIFHARMVTLLTLLWLVDSMLILFAVECILVEGASVMIMFASEYLIMTASLWGTSMKYALNAVDQRSEEPWEQKSMYVFYVELVSDFFKLVTYLLFFTLILSFYGLPLNILRDVYLTLRSFVLKLRDLRRLRQATRNMETLYPDVKREEIDQLADKTCIICREDMEYRGTPEERSREGRRGPNDTPKKLPCGHMFHFHCLRSWLERQQSCPTCRRSVLETNTNPQHQPQPQQQDQQQAQRPAPRLPRPGQLYGGAQAGGLVPALMGLGGAQPPLRPPPQHNDAAGERNEAGPAAEDPRNVAGSSELPASATETRDEQRGTQEPRTIEDAQTLIARSLGRQTFESMFPGVPFPDLPGEQPSAAAAAAPGPSRGAATGARNPLTSFSLPTLPLPHYDPSASGQIPSDYLQPRPLHSPAFRPVTPPPAAASSSKGKERSTIDEAQVGTSDIPALDDETPLSAREAARAAAERRIKSMTTSTRSFDQVDSSASSSAHLATGGQDQDVSSMSSAAAVQQAPPPKRPRLAADARLPSRSFSYLTESALSSPTRLADIEQKLLQRDSAPSSSSAAASGAGPEGEAALLTMEEDEVRARVERRLEKLVAFQERIGSLIDEMRVTLDDERAAPAGGQ